MKVLKKITRRECYKRMGFNRLIVAAFVGEKSLVKRLLEKGLDPHKEKDSNGHSALWWGKRGWVPDIFVSIQTASLLLRI